MLGDRLSLQWGRGGIVRYVCLLSIVLGGLAALFSVAATREGDPRLSLANSSYVAGEGASNTYEREKQFNQALDLYLSLESEFNPIYGDGKLYFNIGNTYFQLGQYPLAIYYYERAGALMPREKVVDLNIRASRDKLNLAAPKVHPLLHNVFFFHNETSLPERLQIFFALSLSLILCISLALWTDNVWIRRGVFTTSFALAIVSCSLVYTRYFAPLEGVLVQSVQLRRDAGAEYARINAETIPAGTVIEIIGINTDGKWIQVITSGGNVGYVEQKVVKVI